MMFGDEFEQLVPKWASALSSGCKCSSVKKMMNSLTAEQTEKSWSKIEFKIYQNARTVSLIKMLPRELVLAAIRRRMDIAFRRSFGRIRAN